VYSQNQEGALFLPHPRSYCNPRCDNDRITSKTTGSPGLQGRIIVFDGFGHIMYDNALEWWLWLEQLAFAAVYLIV
jgi:hypothetical protein